MWVGFLYIVCPTEPSGFFVTITSRNVSELLVCISIVNIMFIYLLFKCNKDFGNFPFLCGQMTGVPFCWIIIGLILCYEGESVSSSPLNAV